MSSSLRLCLLLGLLALLFGSPGQLEAAEETTRTLAAQKCCFTLPGPDWTWLDTKTPNVLFMARNTKGFVINLGTQTTPGTVQVNEQFVKGFEKSFYQPGQNEKRGSRFLTFRDRPCSCYQTEGVLADGRTSATRIFAAHGLMYVLNLLGAKEPIEQDPAFETVMNGFEFTEPPEQPLQSNGAGQGNAPATGAGYPDFVVVASTWMGRIAGVCLLAALGLLVFRRATRKTTKT